MRQVNLVPGEPVIAVERHGAGDPVVFLHGIGGNRTNWADELRRFSARWLALAVDFRGYGDSGDPGETLVFSDFADDVLRALDHHSLAQAHLVGLSMGGLVAQAFYARHPDRVRSMVLVACRPGSAPVAPGEEGASFVNERMGPVLAGGSAALAASLAPRLLGSGASLAARERITASLSALRPASYVKALQARIAAAPFLDLGSISVPVLVLAGEEDQVAPVAQMRAMADAIPGSRFALVPAAGHLLNIEQPELFHQLVSDFLDDMRGGASGRSAHAA